MHRLALAAALLAVPSGSPSPPTPDPLAELFLRGRQVRASLTSVEARFTETTTSSLLEQPLVQTGTLLAAAPGRMRLAYAAPVARTILVEGDRLRLLSPSTGEDEEIDISRTQASVRRYFGEGDEKELRKEFDIELGPSPDVPGALVLGMTPRRKRVRESLARLELTVEGETLLLVRMRIDFPGGERKTIVLEDVRTNVPVAADAFAAPASSDPTQSPGLGSPATGQQLPDARPAPPSLP